MLTKEDQIAISRVEDLIATASGQYRPLASDFLPPHLKPHLKGLLQQGNLRVSFYDFHEDGERFLVLALPDYAREVDALEDICVLSIEGIDGEKLEHRQVMGSILHLGIHRDKVGDIYMMDHKALVVLTKSVAALVLQELSRVGRQPVQIREVDFEAIQAYHPKKRIERITLASPRLDQFVAKAFHLARQKAQDKIASDQVKLNHVYCQSLTKQVEEGDIISLRKKGRIRVLSREGTSKKGNNIYEIAYYE